MKSYNKHIETLKKSKKVTDPKELIKYQIVTEFLKMTSRLETAEILEMTGLDKADLSRLKSLSLKRFSIDRLIGIANAASLDVSIKLSSKKAS